MESKDNIFIRIVEHYLEESQTQLKDTSLTVEDFSIAIANLIEESVILGNIKERKIQLEAELEQLKQLQCPLCGSKVPKTLHKKLSGLKEKLLISDMNFNTQIAITESSVNKVDMYWEGVTESQLKQSVIRLLQELLKEFEKVKDKDETKH